MEDVIRDNDREIDALRKQAFQRPLSPVGKQSTHLNSTTLLHQRIKTLENDYKTLLGVKLECIAEGETTGKVNKEVKNFFTHLKTRLVTSEKDWETERAMWPVSYTHLRAHETPEHLVCRLLLEKKKTNRNSSVLDLMVLSSR
eukprot:TRINITY_DN57258_c0_g1_i1.p1 TRINITY_DN57258_c0_g1~~TRINITY_DN57258_c0_g1_i1.p1  ORF type:complete len:143 (+),score=14.70 TRINITY_DN57258_c0_g1_i1:179-607(+)